MPQHWKENDHLVVQRCGGRDTGVAGQSEGPGGNGAERWDHDPMVEEVIRKVQKNCGGLLGHFGIARQCSGSSCGKQTFDHSMNTVDHCTSHQPIET